MILGTISAVFAGVLVPGISIAQGEITNSFNPALGDDGILNSMRFVAIIITLVGVGIWIFGYVYYAFWQHVAENISFDLRSRYLSKLLQQEISFFEKQNVEQLPS